MKLNDVAQFQQGNTPLNPHVISILELWTGEILQEEWPVAICNRGDNCGASAASEGDVQVLIRCLH
jgi:hypothetical protein